MMRDGDPATQGSGSMSIDYLNRPAGLPPTEAGQSISNLMHMIWRMRPDLQEKFDLEDAHDRERFIRWYEWAAPREFRIPAVIPKGDKAAAAPSNLLYGMKSMAERASRFGQWLPLSVRRRMLRLWTRLAIALSATGVGRKRAVDGEAPQPGVNLIGYANGVLSLGEHLRNTASAFLTASVAMDMVDYRNGARDRQQTGVERLSLAGHNRFSVNLFHINADQMLNAYCHFGHNFFEGRYNIGFWAWELERFPDGWAPVVDLLDEIWAPSRFVQQSIARITDKPVTLMPQCVELPPFETAPRARFGLPDDRCLFIYLFDFLSYIDRKNPVGAIRAFRIAFPVGNEKAGLVLKIMNGNERDPRWQAMLAEIGGDNRILIINETMSRAESFALLACCDCFLSLHRSEGFGRGPAEAMLLGKPVIATAYSGNMDFTLPDNSFLVDYRLIPVERGQYVFGEGQVWAEPDIDHAAWHMRTVFDDSGRAGEVARRGQEHIRAHLSATRTGALMAARLAELGRL